VAASFSTSVQLIVLVNRLPDPNVIDVGQVLIIPVRGLPAPPKTVVETNGYIFPLSESTLRRILTPIAANLTYISVFSFPVDGRGGVDYTPGRARAAVDVARSLGIVPLIVISNFDGTNFNPDLARDAMSGQAGQSTIASIVDVAVSEGFRGINIDFENMYPEDRQLHTGFMAALSDAAHARGLTLSNAMAPKWADWPTLPWVGTFDYAALAPFLDFTMLMTYEWGWSGGPPMAIAPVNLVRRVLDYAVTRIPARKILMGYPCTDTIGRCLRPQASWQIRSLCLRRGRSPRASAKISILTRLPRHHGFATQTHQVRSMRSGSKTFGRPLQRTPSFQTTA